jgi:DNA-binding Xre family transcriptional regulator
MTAKLDYRWHLRQVMAARGMFATTDLIAPLADRGIKLSSSQIYRLVVERPERLSLKILMALLDILDCTMDELIEPVAAQPAGKAKAKAAGGDTGVGRLRPKRARIPPLINDRVNDRGGIGAHRSDRHHRGPGDHGRSRPRSGPGPAGRRGGRRRSGQTPPPGHCPGRRSVGAGHRVLTCPTGGR